MIYNTLNEGIFMSTEKSRNKFADNYRYRGKCMESYIDMLEKNIKIFEDMTDIICKKEYNNNDSYNFISRINEFYSNIESCMKVFGFRYTGTVNIIPSMDYDGSVNNTKELNKDLLSNLRTPFRFADISKMLHIADLKSGKLPKDLSDIANKSKSHGEYVSRINSINKLYEKIYYKYEHADNAIRVKSYVDNNFDTINDIYYDISFDMYCYIKAAYTLRNKLRASEEYLENTIFSNIDIL